MHTCKNCGYRDYPTPITEPEVYESFGKWCTRCWTNESWHAWVHESDTRAEAEEIAEILRKKYNPVLE